MAANSADYFGKVGSPGTATTLAAPGHTSGGTAITVVSTTNWPTDTGVIFAMDTVSIVNGVEVRNVGSYTEFEGIVSGATSITSMVLRYGTDQNYPAGSTSRVYIPVASSRENRLVDGLLVEHDQDGTHKTITTDTVTSTGNADLKTVITDTISEKTAAHGVIIDGLTVKDGLVVGGAGAGVSNAGLETTAGEPGGAWKAWTPTLANWTVGANAVDAKYTLRGKTVHFRLSWKFGAGAAMGAGATFTLPVTSISYPMIAQTQILGTGSAFDSGVGPYAVQPVWSSTTVAILQVWGAGGTYLSPANFSATVPMTWASNDELFVQGTYEAA